MYFARNILEKEAEAFNGYGLEWNSSLFPSPSSRPGRGAAHIQLIDARGAF